MKEQAARFGAEMRDGSIVKADFSSRPFHLTDERDNEIEAETVIIATGASAKYLGLADEEKYRGQGVSACATCDGFFYYSIQYVPQITYQIKRKINQRKLLAMNGLDLIYRIRL